MRLVNLVTKIVWLIKPIYLVNIQPEKLVVIPFCLLVEFGILVKSNKIFVEITNNLVAQSTYLLVVLSGNSGDLAVKTN